MARRRSGSTAKKPRAHKIASATPSGSGFASKRVLQDPPEASEADDPQALVLIHWFDSGDDGEPYDARVRISGRRRSLRGLPKAGDSFSKDEAIEGVVPGTGPVSITTWVYGLNRGEWDVDARLVRSGDRAPRSSSPSSSAAIVKPAKWSWRRWAISTSDSNGISTRSALLAPLARQPAVIPGVYFALAVVGFVLAVVLQAAILAGEGIMPGSSLAASGLAIVGGLVGAKGWYAILHPDESIIRGGWAVDGFLIVAPLVAAVTLYALDQPIGTALDATAPGIFFAVALGRVGCFLTGCCAGRCTASRWGIWSSDRRVGSRRIPTQLLEAGAGLALGVLSLLVVIAGGLPVAGGVFVATFAGYAAIRQGLLRLRSERRRVQRTLPLTAVAAGVVAVIVAALSLVQPG